VSRSRLLRDISIPLGPGTPEWPGDTPYECGWSWQIARGASVNVSAIRTSPHVGTHADAPLHVKDGWPGAHELPLEAFIGPALVLDATAVSDDDAPLSMAVLDAIAEEQGTSLARVERLLLRTGRSIAAGRFPTAWPAITEDAARELLGRGLRLFGVDAPSVDERESKTLAVHHMLFGGGAYNLENLDLRRITTGEYELLAAPIKIMNGDAAFVRAVLVGT
jgi:arylformamidase